MEQYSKRVLRVVFGVLFLFICLFVVFVYLFVNYIYM